MRVRRLITAVAAAALCAVIAAPAAANQRYRYPLNGPHNYGDLTVTGFGVKRANGTVHLGQDVIADCGTPIVAVHDGVVKSVGYSAGYGFYVVLRGEGTRFDFVYGHLKGRSWVRRGKTVRAGQRIGSVGQTGTDSGVCHLHFELWKGRWFAGGSRTDPLPHLQAWDKYSGGPLQTEPAPPPDTYSSISKRLYYDTGA